MVTAEVAESMGAPGGVEPPTNGSGVNRKIDPRQG